MRIQAPPNLVSREECLALIAAGVDDWGGVRPLTPTTSTPNGPGPLWMSWTRSPRGRIRFVQPADRATGCTGRCGVDRPAGAGHVVALADPATGWLATSTPWAGRGRSRRRRVLARLDCTRRSTPRAGPRVAQRPGQRVPAIGDRSVRTCTSWRPRSRALRHPTCPPRSLGRARSGRLHRRRDWRWRPPTARDEAVAALADRCARGGGDDVTFVVNRTSTSPTLLHRFRFCAFAQRKGDADAYRCPLTKVAERAWEAHVAGATEVHAGGIDPELPITGYADLVRAVKARVPSMHVHASRRWSAGG